jgi:hypothetical protein
MGKRQAPREVVPSPEGLNNETGASWRIDSDLDD